ncbi:uncharacterized protein Fot_25203 [Forsythia ovata]|uniref:Uncharacterized protein n=1 Tax=Forsythia ovata TaxID=205694 RepID=A0ABD1U8D6_9LAMI
MIRGHTEVEFQIQTQNEDHFEAYSSPLWTRPSRSFHHEAYTLLPSNHHYSSSPTSRLRAIANGRRELMEMIKDISESSYELSLKDIVEDKHRKEKEKSGKIVEERNSNKTETRNSRKSVTARRSQISRTQSMESGAFLLKIFLPIPQSSKKNSKARNCAKNSPGTSSERSEKQANKDLVEDDIFFCKR